MARFAKISTLVPAFAALALALGAAGCDATLPSMPDPVASHSPPPPSDPAALRTYAESLEPRYAQNPDDKVTTIHYAQALRGLGQHAQAVAVLQGLAVKNPHDMPVLAAYGKALADAGRLQEAANVLERAHTPDRPSWSVLSAQGSVADQMGDHAAARRYYDAALNIRPNQPDVLSNMGLSFALDHRLPQAEQTLRLAAEQPQADARVRQNLALVLSLEGKYADAETVSRKDMTPLDAAENVATLKQTIAGSPTWAGVGAGVGAGRGAAPARRTHVARKAEPRVQTASSEVEQ